MRKLLFLVLFIHYSVVFSQNNQPIIRFFSDSVMLGELVEIELLYQHPKELEVLFPDSTFNFAPFEFVEKKLFVTKTTDSLSVDCTIYIIQTFELEKVQELTLGATIFSTKDSVFISSNTASVFLKEMIQQLPDTLNLIANTDFAPVETEFNYPYFLIGLGIIVFLGIILFFVFGKKIKQNIQLFWIKRKHIIFMKQFQIEIDTNTSIEQNIRFWKKHIGWLEKMELDSLTTKEINALYDNEELQKTLSNADAFIFGNKKIDDVSEIYTTLKNFAEVVLHKRIETIKNARTK